MKNQLNRPERWSEGIPQKKRVGRKAYEGGEWPINAGPGLAVVLVLVAGAVEKAHGRGQKKAFRSG
jgi:hypothetical protein